MEDELAKDKPRVQADNQSIAIGEINITGTVTGNITIGHTIVQPADGIVATLGNPLAWLGMAVKEIVEKAKEETGAA